MEEELMATIQVDGRSVSVDPEQNLLEACLGAGFELPYFCWHPALGSVGACRQCAVKLLLPDGAQRIAMACMTPAADGTRLSIADPEAVSFRAAVIEWLMLNHPHDCPVCDEGGECHLQDMTLMTGHVVRRRPFPKRTYRNQDLGPLVNHEMNRCIQCYRCVRYYRDHAGGRDLDAFGAHDEVYFGRADDGPLESEFSGNLVEVCPTGVFTDKTLKAHYTRKWDLSASPSICVHCGAGCNISPGAHGGRIRRIQNRWNPDVNGYFLCDRGRYGHGFVDGERRIRSAGVRERRALPAGSSPSFTTITSVTAITSISSMTTLATNGSIARVSPVGVADALGRARAALARPERVIGIGSPRASLESNFALRRLVGPDRFFLGLAAEEAKALARVLEVLKAGPSRAASIRDIEESDAALVLGGDPSALAPRLALALRQTARRAAFEAAAKSGVPRWHDAALRTSAGPAIASGLFVLSPAATRLDDAAHPHRGAPDDLARITHAAARLLDPRLPAVEPLSEPDRRAAESLAAILGAARRPVVVAAIDRPAWIEAAASVSGALGGRAALAFLAPECNSLGLALLGGRRLEEAFELVNKGEADTAIILENDLFRRATAGVASRFFARLLEVVLLDHTAHETADHATTILPAATFAESSGTLVSYEGRAQRFFSALPEQPLGPDGDGGSMNRSLPSWRWLLALGGASSTSSSGNTGTGTGTGSSTGRGPRTLDSLIVELSQEIPTLAGIRDAAPPHTGRPIPRQPPRASGRTAVRADRLVQLPPPRDPDSPLAFTMEGDARFQPVALQPFYWLPGWNSIQATFLERSVGPRQNEAGGTRLLEPTPGAPPSPGGAIAPRFEPKSDALLVVRVPRVFGADELSLESPPIRRLLQPAELSLHPADAEEAGVREGERAALELAGRRRSYTVRVLERVPRGLVLIAADHPELQALPCPSYARVEWEGAGA
jgi:NADH-quinone oxidoreductase subunit G